MDLAIVLEYAWVLVVLIGLEGLLAADNALVIAVMVKHLPEAQRKKALFYGLAGAFAFRTGSLFVISFLVDVWQLQAIGALYLMFIAGNHLVRKYVLHREDKHEEIETTQKNGSGFWTTVLKVELADIAFAVDSILAAVALAVTLPATDFPHIGGLDGAQFGVVLTGGLIGVVIMRFAAMWFVKLLKQKPGLETAAFLIVGWVGVKLVVFTLAHPEIAVLDEHFPKLPAWKLTFWVVLVGIALGGWFLSKEDETEELESTKGDVAESLEK